MTAHMWARAVALPCPAPNPDGSFTITVRINTATVLWAIGWGSADADGAVTSNYLSHAWFRLVRHGTSASSNPPEPVFGGVPQDAFRQNSAVGLLFECTYDPAKGTMRARYPNATVPALRQSCVLFNDITVGAPLVPIIRFHSEPKAVGVSLTVMNP